MSDAAEPSADESKSAAGPKVLDYLWVALGLAVLAAIAATLVKEPKPKFQFPDPPKPPPASTPAASPASTNSVPMAGTDVIEGASAPLQALFIDAQQQQRGQSLFVTEPDPPFVTPTPAQVNRPREVELGQAYQSLSRTDTRALDKVSRMGGYGSPDRMAAAFGYLSVGDMVAAWARAEAEGNPFRTTEAPPAN